jgi:sulfate adenylyltransferase subunit 2
MYFAKDGKRFRSIGCMPCTSPIESKASNIDEIIEELRTTLVDERSGRALDKEKIQRRLRELGYM